MLALTAVHRALDQAVHMMRTRGIGAFYAGVMAPAIQKGIGISFMFGAMEALRTLTGAHPWDTPIRWMVCCAMVGFFESFVYCPLDLIKARLQVGREKSILECARAITKTNGTFGVYLGWRLHALKEMVGNIGLFTGFEAGNALFLSLGLPTPVATCLGGSVSGVLYYFLPHPFDTLKSIVQTAEVRARGLVSRSAPLSPSVLLSVFPSAFVARAPPPRRRCERTSGRPALTLRRAPRTAFRPRGPHQSVPPADGRGGHLAPVRGRGRGDAARGVRHGGNVHDLRRLQGLPVARRNPSPRPRERLASLGGRGGGRGDAEPLGGANHTHCGLLA